MSPSLRPIPGSEKGPPVGMRALGRADPREPIAISVYLAGPPIDGRSAGGPGQDPRAALRTARERAQSGDVDAIAGFALANGLEIAETDPARRLVRVVGTTAQMEEAFGTELHLYEADGATHRVRTGSLHMPEELVGRVIAVLGLDTRPVATPKFVRARSAAATPGFLPTAVAALYGLSGAEADGECVGIVELGGGYTDADNRAAFAAMGLPVPSIVAIPVDGGTNAPGGDADGEVALDIQVAGGVAPGASLAIYFAPNTSQGFVDAISQAVHDADNRPSALSISWGSAETGWSGQSIAAMSAAFADAAALGVTVTAASGDALATDGVSDGKAHVDYPASDPNVLGCGGTRLATAGGDLTGETVWNSDGSGTGGGVSSLFARPSYQKGVAVPPHRGAKGGRGVPDVAGDADPATGYRVVEGGASSVIGGTSAAAPLWAAIAATLNAGRKQPIGRMHEALYGEPSALRDITRGDNKAGKVGFAARSGWDACTGLGSPNGMRLRELFPTSS